MMDDTQAAIHEWHVVEHDALLGEFDATKWAATFVDTVKRKPAIATDPGTMVAWFASAIMAGHDKAKREESAQLATFELQLTVVDHPTDRRRWNGGPMPSEDANAALHDAVEGFQDKIRERGFEIVHTGYGVKAEEIGDDVAS